MKTYELLSILGAIAAVGIALGAVVIGSNSNLHEELRVEMRVLRTEMQGDMQELRTEMRGEMQALRTEVRTEVRSLETRLAAVERRQVAIERRQARTEGLLEGLRDAIVAQGTGEPRSPEGET